MDKDLPKIRPIENGPLMVEGVAQIAGPDGSAITPEKPGFALCRCGLSRNKPYCDGTHKSAGFSSDNNNAKIRNTPIEYKGEVEGEQVTISYTPVLCGHIGECARLAGAVFDPSRKPWIRPELGSLEAIREVVRTCPSGALRMSVGEGAPEHIDGDAVSLGVAKNGPYIVKNIAFEAEFNAAGASEKEYILCRCGLSRNKPFCDGSHHDAKWQDEG